MSEITKRYRFEWSLTGKSPKKKVSSEYPIFDSVLIHYRWGIQLVCRDLLQVTCPSAFNVISRDEIILSLHTQLPSINLEPYMILATKCG